MRNIFRKHLVNHLSTFGVNSAFHFTITMLAFLISSPGRWRSDSDEAPAPRPARAPRPAAGSGSGGRGSSRAPRSSEFWLTFGYVFRWHVVVAHLTNLIANCGKIFRKRLPLVKLRSDSDAASPPRPARAPRPAARAGSGGTTRRSVCD